MELASISLTLCALLVVFLGGTVWIGIALFPEDGFSTAELLRRADIALYRAKVSGRSSFRFFEVAMDASILHRTLLEQRLRTAIAKAGIPI